MVAYSFKAQFADPIQAGRKVQTLRNDRKRHARPHEELQLYTGMRTRQCRLIGRAKCIAIGAVRLDFKLRRVDLVHAAYVTPFELDTFARMDGFEDWAALEDFWRANHPEIRDAWEGVRILWANTFRTDANA